MRHSSAAPRTRPGRRAASFVEIIIAMALLGGALVPIASMLIDTAGQSASTKAEAAAASYAAKLLNRFLDEVDFDDAVLEDTGAGSPHASEDFGGNPTVDNTVIRWNLEVRVIPNTSIFFQHYLLRYHDPASGTPCTGGAEAKISAATVLTPTVSRDVNVTTPNEKSVDDLDRKNAGQPVLKELRLTIQWKTPRDSGFENLADPGVKRRTVSLLTRRARLTRRNLP